MATSLLAEWQYRRAPFCGEPSADGWRRLREWWFSPPIALDPALSEVELIDPDETGIDPHGVRPLIADQLALANQAGWSSTTTATTILQALLDHGYTLTPNGTRNHDE